MYQNLSMPFKAGVEGILLSCVGSSGQTRNGSVVTSTPMKRLPKGLWYAKYFTFNFTIGIRCVECSIVQEAVQDFEGRTEKNLITRGAGVEDARKKLNRKKTFYSCI